MAEVHDAQQSCVHESAPTATDSSALHALTPAGVILAYQRGAGNAAVSRLLMADRASRLARQAHAHHAPGQPGTEQGPADLETRMRRLEASVSGLTNRMSALAIAEEYQQQVFGRFEVLETGVRNAVSGYALANQRYERALAAMATAQATRSAIMLGLVNTLFAGVAEWMIGGAVGLAARAVGPASAAWNIDKIVEALENPANALMGTATAAIGTAIAPSPERPASADAARQLLPRAPTPRSGSSVPAPASRQTADPLVLLNDTLNAVQLERSRARDFFANKARQTADPHDPAWERFDPEAYRRLYNDWLARTNDLARVAAAVSSERVALALEKGLWASWLRQNVHYIRVDAKTGVIEGWHSVANQIWVRLRETGIASTAGASGGWLYDDDDDLQRLVQWAGSYQPAPIVQ